MVIKMSTIPLGDSQHRRWSRVVETHTYFSSRNYRNTTFTTKILLTISKYAPSKKISTSVILISSEYKNQLTYLQQIASQINFGGIDTRKRFPPAAIKWTALFTRTAKHAKYIKFFFETISFYVGQ